MKNKHMLAMITVIGVLALSGCSFDKEKAQGNLLDAKDAITEKVATTKEGIEGAVSKVGQTIEQTKANIEEAVQQVNETVESVNQAVDSIQKAKADINNAVENVKSIGEKEEQQPQEDK